MSTSLLSLFLLLLPAAVVRAQPAVIITDGFGVSIMCWADLGEGSSNSVHIWGAATLDFAQATPAHCAYAKADGSTVFFGSKGKSGSEGFLAKLPLPSPSAASATLPLAGATDVFRATPPGDNSGVGQLCGTGRDSYLDASVAEYLFYFWDDTSTTKQDIRVFDVKNDVSLGVVRVNQTGCTLGFGACYPDKDLLYYNGSVYWWYPRSSGGLDFIECPVFTDYTESPSTPPTLATSCVPVLSAHITSTTNAAFSATPSPQGWVLGTSDFSTDVTELFLIPFGDLNYSGTASYTFNIPATTLGLAANYDLSYNWDDGYLYFVCFWGCKGDISRLRLSDWSGFAGSDMGDQLNQNSVAILSTSCPAWLPTSSESEDSSATTVAMSSSLLASLVAGLILCQ